MKFYLFECWFLYEDNAIVEIVAAESQVDAKKLLSDTSPYGRWEFVKELKTPENPGVVFSTHNRF